MAKLESMGGNVDEAMEKGTKSAMRAVQATAKSLCPAVTGDLRASVQTKYERNGDNHIGHIFTNKEYAPFVEFGTGPAGRGTYPYPVEGLSYKADKWRAVVPEVGVRWVSGQKAQPFLYPALIENREAVLALIERAFTREIIKAAKK